MTNNRFFYHTRTSGVLDTNAKIRMSSSEVKAVLDFASGASKHPADFDSAVSRMISHTFPDVAVPLWDRFLPSLPDEDIALRATLVLCLIYWLYMYFQVSWSYIQCGGNLNITQMSHVRRQRWCGHLVPADTPSSSSKA